MSSPLFDSPLLPPHAFVERRRRPDRRYGQRRRARQASSTERRSVDRRHPLDRRETPAGHLRNALQMLTLVDRPRLPEPERDALVAAAERLWLAIFELQRRAEEPPDHP